MSDVHNQNSSASFIGRRELLGWLAGGAVAIAGGRAMAGVSAAGGNGEDLEPRSAGKLHELTRKLASAPRRRSFDTVPMILTHESQWDSEALNLLLDYKGGPRQVWDNTDLTSPWLNLMRNAANAQRWSFKNPDYVAVSATHGPCHLALYDDFIWAKYKLGAFTGGKFHSNVFLSVPEKVAHADPADFNNPAGLFSPEANCIDLLQDRGIVFLACHNAIWEFTGALLAKGHNPEGLTHEQVAAELTNHLIDGAVLTPGIVGTIPLLEAAGYRYTK